MIAPAEIVVRKLRPRNRPERASSRAPANNSCLTSKPERRLLCRAAEFAAEFPITTEVERKIAERLLEDQRNVAWDVATEQFAPGTTVVDYLCAPLLVSSRTPATTAARFLRRAPAGFARAGFVTDVFVP